MNTGAGRPAELARTLGYHDLLIYGLAYVAPLAPITTLGFVWQTSHGLIALAYLLGAVCMFFTAKSYALMADEVPNAGSVYGFARHALGPFWGFIAGWMVLLDYLLIPAYIYVLMAVALGTLIPSVPRFVWILLLGGVTLSINWFGIKTTSRVNFFSVVGQLLILALLALAALWALHKGAGTGGLTLAPFHPTGPVPWNGVFAATSICVMSFLGFDAVSTLSEEVKSSDRRIVGRAIVAVLLISAAMFILLAWILGNLTAGFSMGDPAVAIFDVTGARIGAWMGILLAWTNATLVGFTNALPMQVGVARVLFAMGRDQQLPAALSRVHAVRGTPYIGMLVTAFVSVGVAVLMRDRMDELVSVVNFGALSAFLLLHCSVIVLFTVRSRLRRWQVHLVNPLLGILIVIAVLGGMSTTAKALGAVWLSVGLIYGGVLQRRRAIDLRL